MANGQSNNVTVVAGTPSYSQQNGGQSSSVSPTIGKECNQLQVILTVRMLMQGKVSFFVIFYNFIQIF